jgi:mannose-6-phosphate isomerase-like protein (cupin superfamily)
MTARALSTHPVHLDADRGAHSEPAFGGMPWYADYVQRHAADGARGRLVSMYRFETSWESWEMHPEGSEVVVCTEGRMTLLQETAAGVTRIELAAGEYAINPPGVWHTADLTEPATALFITAGWGTQHRVR